VTQHDLPGTVGLLVHARVYEAARVNPPDVAAQLSEQLGRPLLLEREDPQPWAWGDVPPCMRKSVSRGLRKRGATS